MIAGFVGNGYYDSAGTENHSFTEWNPSRGITGDIENIGSYKPISARAWDLIRNNTTSNSLITTLGNGVIGTGLKVLPTIDHETLGIEKSEAKKLNAKLLKLFNLWAASENSTVDRKNNFAMFQMRLFLNYVISGDSFVIFRNNSAINKSKKFAFDLTCEGVDANSVCNPLNQLDTVTLAGGIEVNKYNEEIAYHFRKNSLTDLLYNVGYNYETVRIPRYGSRSGRRNVLHIHTPLRFNERRGVSMFAPLMEALKQLDRYDKSELMATVIASFFTAVIETETDDEMDLPRNKYGQPVMGSGNFTYMNPGEKLNMVNPNRPNPNFAAFEEAYWGKISSALGMSQELVKIRFDTSYTAARAALLTTYNNFKIKRTEFNFLCNQPTYEEFVTECVLKGLIELPGFLLNPLKKQAWLKTTWVGDAMMILDPIKEAQAAKIMRDEQFKSQDQIVRELTGNTYSDTLDQIDDENQLRRDKEVLLPGEYDRETKRFDAQRKIEASEKVEEPNGETNV